MSKKNEVTGFDLFLANIPSIICLIIAGILILNNVNNWSWFIAFALLFGKTIGSSDDKDEKEEQCQKNQ